MLSRALSPAVALVLVSVQIAGKVARDALFVRGTSAKELAVALAVAGAVSVVTALAASRRGGHERPAHMLAVTLLSSAVLFLLEAHLLALAPRVAAWMALLHVGALGPLTMSYLWMSFAERFRGDGAGDAFLAISSAATLGGVLGGIFAERVARTFSMATLLVALAGFSIAVACWAMSAGRAETRLEAPAMPDLRSTLRTIGSDKLLTRAAMLIALTATGSTVADYLMKSAVAVSRESESSVVIFFSLFHTTTGVLTFLVQATLGPRLVSRLGVSGALALVPAAFVSMATFGVLAWRVATAVLLRGADTVLTNSIFRSTYELLYTAVPTEARRRAKPIIDILALRAGDLLASLGIAALVFASPDLSAPLLLAFGAVTACVSVWLAHRVGAEFRARAGGHAADRRRGSFLTTRTEPA